VGDPPMSRRKPPPQEIIRGPAVQGQAPRERRESPDAGTAGARTVDERPAPEASGTPPPPRKRRR
jgi:hypothetical protein